MGSYVPSTGAQREEMLRTVGVSSTRELFRDVPQEGCPSSEVLGQWGFGFSGGLGSSGVDI